MPAGRPTDYSAELAARFCAELAKGRSVRSICDAEDMPSKASIFLWIAKHPEFSDQYAEAKKAGLEVIADEIMDIADNGVNDWMEKHDPDNPGYQYHGEHVNRSRLRIDTRKWLLSKLVPKKYGDKMAVTGEDGGPLEVRIIKHADD